MKQRSVKNEAAIENIELELTSNSDRQEYTPREGHAGITGYLLIIISLVIIVFTFPLSLIVCIRVIDQYERIILMRLGLLRSVQGPGVVFVIPCTDMFYIVDLRTTTLSVPTQEILSKDNVTVSIDATVVYRIFNPKASVLNVYDVALSTSLLAQTTLRNVLGTMTLSQMLSDRNRIVSLIESLLDEATDQWGVKVERVEILNLNLPVQLQRAMAAEAESVREARAKVISAEGEKSAARAMAEASNMLGQSETALQLRYLQTMAKVATEKNSTLVFPMPIDLMIN